MKVVVVGAGFAGLMAAWRLSERGCQVVVLEARERVGGRVWSRELILGDRRTVIERGAEFVLDGYDVLREVAAGLGLELAATVMSYYQREPRGGGLVSASEVDDCAAWVAAASAAAPRGTSLAEVAAGWAGQPAALAAYLSRIETTDGMSADRLSAAVAQDPTAGFGWRPSWRVAGGNQQVATGLARRLGPAVRLASPVRAVQQDHHGVQLSTPGGTVTGDAAVIAVPMAVLRPLPIGQAVPDHRQRPLIGFVAEPQRPFADHRLFGVVVVVERRRRSARLRSDIGDGGCQDAFAGNNCPSGGVDGGLRPAAAVGR